MRSVWFELQCRKLVPNILTKLVGKCRVPKTNACAIHVADETVITRSESYPPPSTPVHLNQSGGLAQTPTSKMMGC